MILNILSIVNFIQRVNLNMLIFTEIRELITSVLVDNRIMKTFWKGIQALLYLLENIKLLDECSTWPWWKIASLNLEVDVFKETQEFALQFSNDLVPTELIFTKNWPENLCNTGDNDHF